MSLKSKVIKIGINIDPVLPGSCYYYKGIGTYTRGLISGLKEVDKENEYILFYTSKKGEPLKAGEKDNFKFRKRPAFKSFFLNNIINYGLKDADILHFPSADGPWCKKRTVVTVHDLITLIKYKTAFTANPRLRIWQKVKYHTICRAAKIIAVSQHTRNDLIKYFHIKPDKIRVIYEGVDDIFCFRKDVLKKYILASGSEWNKNTKAVIKAYYNLKSDIPLIINAAADKELGAYIRKHNLESKVSFTGHISREAQLTLYNGAIVFVFPSIEEGFGLPLVEAMACGLPIITSSTSSMPEVAGNAGILVDPYNIMEIASVLKEVLKNSSLRSALSQKSIDRAKFFSWEKTARETLEVYKSIY